MNADFHFERASFILKQKLRCQCPVLYLQSSDNVLYGSVAVTFKVIVYSGYNLDRYGRINEIGCPDLDGWAGKDPIFCSRDTKQKPANRSFSSHWSAPNGFVLSIRINTYFYLIARYSSMSSIS